MWKYNGQPIDRLPASILDGEWNRPQAYFKLSDGSWNYPALAARGYTWEEPAAPAPPTLEQAKAAKTVQVRDAAEAFLAPFGVEYGATERATWDQQYAEALAGDGPLLQAIAAARGQEVAALAAAILANRAAWVALAGCVTGQRLAYQDQVDAAQSVAEVQAIVPAYELPGA